MKRYMLSALSAFAAIVLAIVPTVATAQDKPFQGAAVEAFVEHDGKYAVWGGTGNSTVLGNFSIVVYLHWEGGSVGYAHSIWTAANGDILYTHSDSTTPGGFAIDGGTGRFKNATGSAAVVVIVNSDGTVTVTHDGTISF